MSRLSFIASATVFKQSTSSKVEFIANIRQTLWGNGYAYIDGC